MESNICSVFSKISANDYSPFQNSSVLAPNGEIATNFLVNAALKTENGFTIDTLGANTNITNGMNLENLSCEVNNNIESDSNQKPTSLWDKFFNKNCKQPLKRGFNASCYRKHRAFSKNFFLCLIQANRKIPMDPVKVSVGIFLSKV